MNLPLFISSIKLANINEKLLLPVVRLMGFKVDEDLLQDLFNIIQAVRDSSPDITLGEISADEHFVNLVTAKVTDRILDSKENKEVLLESIVKCPFCERQDKLALFAPKLKI